MSDASKERSEHAWENLVTQRDDVLARHAKLTDEHAAIKADHAAKLKEAEERHAKQVAELTASHTDAMAKLKEASDGSDKHNAAVIAEQKKWFAEQQVIIDLCGGMEKMREYVKAKRLAEARAAKDAADKAVAELEATGV